MFEEPQAKRVRRSQVFKDAESGTESDSGDNPNVIEGVGDVSPEIAYHFDYEIVENEAGKATKFAHLRIHEPPSKEATEEEFEFRLFSAPKASATGRDDAATAPRAQTKVNIRSPTPTTPSDGRFINPYRPWTYYFASEPSVDTLAAVAVSGSDILERSHDPWPGTALAWRVVHLPSSKPKVADLSDAARVSLKTPAPASKRKLKPSKKRRILLRTRAKAVEEKVKEKEEHLREKKTRLNREKKLKRKAKEKAAKLAGKEGEGGSDRGT